MLIIGIAGHPSSGKDTSAEYIASKGYIHISLGDILREEMKKIGLPIDRPSIRQFVTEKRKEKGAFYPVNLACEKITDNTIITGFRNLAEVAYVRERYKNHFILIALDAPLTARYERALKRDREGDNLTFEEFKEHDEAERNNNPESHEVDNVLAEANYIIKNTGSQSDLYHEIDQLLTKIKK
jgi:dephospho-CoA kinase